MKTHKLIIGDKRVSTKEFTTVIYPYNGKPVANVCMAGPKELDLAIKSSQEAFKVTRNFAGHDVSSLLRRAIHGIIQKRKLLVDTIVAEAGKPVAFAEQEVDRTISTFRVAAEEATRRMGGEYLPLDIDARAADRFAVTKRFPVGVVGGISPFNFPLNLVAHKVAPVIASRNTMVLKPATKTPITALLLGEILLEAGMTPGQINVVPCHSSVGEALATDDRIKKLTFTGSPKVGWRLKAIAGMKRLTLELGGNAAAVVMADANLKWAVPRIVAGSFAYSGQTCISVQRILIQKRIYDKTVRALVAEIKKNVKVGDPRRSDVMVGPMINISSLEQTQDWVQQAVEGGAKVLIGGNRKRRCFSPTLLSNVKNSMNVVCKEVFAPVSTVQSFSTFDQAMNMVNNSDFGLQMGIFTNSHEYAWRAFDMADVGGVVINDFPTFRVDNMPYGGVKMSGLGREGVKYAMDEMTEIKVMVMKK
jgi:glyceraldehyde-3-phosphate dehydrogenase (NADP+)